MAAPRTPSSDGAAHAVARLALLCALVLGSGCRVVDRDYQLGTAIGAGTGITQAARTDPESDGSPDGASPIRSDTTDDPGAERKALRNERRPGTEIFTLAPRGATPRAEAARESGDVTLNFENTSLLEVVKVILGDLLERNYVVDPAVNGAVTLQTSRALPSDALLPTLEMLLRMNGAALVESDGLFHIVPRDAANRGLVSPQLGQSDAPLPGGYGIRIVPLRFVSAQEMQKILEPFASEGSIVRVDSLRNLLVLAGPASELGELIDLTAIFDVDWMQGLSFGLYTPDFAEAKDLAPELEEIFASGADGPTGGLLRFVVLDRLNALLVVSPRRSYLEKAEQWIDRLDRDVGQIGQRLFVYQVQNGKAVDLADVLNRVFREEGDALPAAEVAPGLEAAVIATAGQTADEDEAAPRREAIISDGLAVSTSGDIRIIADEINNALLVMASADEYRQVLAALRKLDIVPLQVLIEATIAEVILTDDLSLGLEWFFDNNLGNYDGTAKLDLGTGVAVGAAPNFSFALTNAAGVVKAVLNTLASESKLNVVSSPSLLVLNNQMASIQVGDQVPVTTQQQQSTSTAANVVNNIEFRDTGVLLTVTPRVNAGGLVIMELEQEVSDVAPTTSPTLTPTIQQRRITSTVAIQTGETIVLGGLIRDRKSASNSGIPGLHDLPLIGWLFGAQSDDQRRTELVVLITPRVVRGSYEARRITEEFRDKMESLRPIRGMPERLEPLTQESTTPAPNEPVNRNATGTRAFRLARDLGAPGVQAPPSLPRREPPEPLRLRSDTEIASERLDSSPGSSPLPAPLAFGHGGLLSPL